MARPRVQKDTDVLIAVATGWVNHEGRDVLIRNGETRAHAGSSLARAFPGYFKPIDVHFAVEQATAAPGEKRGA